MNMKKMETLIVVLVMAFEFITIIGLMVYIFKTETSKKNGAVQTVEVEIGELTTQFDKQLQEVFEVKNQIEEHDLQFVWLSPGIYKSWEIVNWQKDIIFGFKEAEDGLKVILGDFDGTVYESSFIWDAQNPEIVEFKLTRENLVLSQVGQNYLKFQWYDRTYIMDYNLNVWRVVES